MMGRRVGVGALLFCVLATGPAMAASNPAETVPFDIFASDAVQKLVDEGIIVGYPRTYEARVDQVMTRYEFAAAWAKLAPKLGLPQEAGPGPALRTDVPEGHWARPSVEYLASLGLLPVGPFEDVDPLHWAAASVAELSGPGTDGGTKYLEFRGDEPLMRREYMDMVKRTGRAILARHPDRRVYSDLQLGDVERMVSDEGLFIGYPRTHELRPYWPMTRLDFCLATVRLFGYPAFGTK